MKVTEQSSNYSNLDKMTTRELLCGINAEDKTVAHSVEKVIDQLEKFVDATVERMKKGGRLFYMGAGTSGRLGIVDASEIPPTYGVEHGIVVGLIAGGDGAIRKAVEKIDNKVPFEMEPLVERVLLNSTFEMYYYKALERFGVKAEEMLNKYTSADFKKGYTEDDIRYLLDETEIAFGDGNKNATTDHYYDKLPGNRDSYSVSFRGYGVTLERVHSDY